MEPQGYRKQQDEELAAAPAEQRVANSTTSLLVGIAAVVVTVVALFVLVRVMSGGPGVAQTPDGQAQATGGGPVGGDEDLGSQDAPIQIIGFPGHCEDHMKVCATLRTLADEHPDAIHVTFRQMQSPEAQELGLTCASYVMKFDRFKELGFTSEGQTTGGEYEILATKSPSAGAAWQAADIEALLRKAIDLASAAPAGDQAASAADEAKPDAPADGADAKAADGADTKAADDKDQKAAPEGAKAADEAAEDPPADLPAKAAAMGMG